MEDVCVWVSIDTPIDPWLTSHQHLHWYSVNRQLTSQLAVSRQSPSFCRHTMECWWMHISRSTPPSIDLGVNQVLIKPVNWGYCDWYSTIDLFNTHDPSWQHMVGWYSSWKDFYWHTASCLKDSSSSGFVAYPPYMHPFSDLFRKWLLKCACRKWLIVSLSA